MKDRAGRKCPTREHAPRTVEGKRLWAVLRGPGVWTGGGMTRETIDRAAIVARLDPDVPRWVIDELLDVYEPAVLDSRHTAAKIRRAPPPPSPPPQ